MPRRENVNDGFGSITERQGRTRPRIYTITVRYADEAGNVTNVAVLVTVP